MGKFPPLLCLTSKGRILANGVGEVVVVTLSFIISKLLYDSMVSLSSSINSITTIFPKIS